jgi:Resolvase, N terminal domain
MTTRLRVGLYARVSTHDQQTLPLQLDAMRAYVAQRGWMVVTEVRAVSSGPSNGLSASNYCRPHDDARLMLCSCGDWIAGGVRWRT